MLSEIIFEVMPAFGFALCASGFAYISLMYKDRTGTHAFIYANALLDTLLGFSLIYAGIHGVLMLSYGDSIMDIQPISCIIQALHISLWCYVDSGHYIILLLMSMDQLSTVLMTKTHDKWSSKFYQSGLIIVILLSSAALLAPSWWYSMESASNMTIRVSPLCLFDDVVSDDFYDFLLEFRKWVPVISLVFLALTSLLLMAFQIRDSWNYKWTDNNEEATRLFFYVLFRCLMAGFAAHVPGFLMRNRKIESGLSEVVFRLTESMLFGIFQPLIVLYSVPKYSKNMWIFFNKYAHNTKRTWQSADDPPEEKHGHNGSHDNFGSWYSTTGNIVGEAGIPYETSKEQRSVSFYYDD